MKAPSVAALLPLCLLGIHGCAEPNPVAPEADTGPAHTAIPRADVSGTWEFSETIITIQPSELNGLIGANPSDRPRTRVVCKAQGTLDLTQVGGDFSGTGSQSVTCNTPEGPQDFVPPPFAFAPVFTIHDGTVSGRAIRFRIDGICSNRGAVQGRAADRLAVAGSCDVGFPGVKNHAVIKAWRP